MELLRGLGLDSSVGIQLVIFLITYLILHFVLFKPYFAAYNERLKRTMGQADLAEKYLAESQALQAVYENKARELSAQYKAIYDDSRLKAQREYDQTVSAARQTAKTQFETTKQKIRTELDSARKESQKEVPAVAGAITARLLGKDLIQ